MNFATTLPASSVSLVQKALDRANKKAHKMGLPGLTMSVERFQKTNQDGSLSNMAKVVLTGEEVVLKGWKFIGVISVLKDDSGKKLPLITSVPGETADQTRYSADPLFCAHCKARRDRIETYIVRHESGEEKQVGSSCLKDFIGDNNTSPDAVARWAGICIALQKEVSDASLGERDFDAFSFVNIIAITEAVSRVKGWVSKARSTPGNPPTANWVKVIMSDMHLLARIDNPADFQNFLDMRGLTASMIPAPSDYQNAQSILEALSVSLDRDEENGEVAKSDYLHALRTMVTARTANKKAFNIAVSYKAYMLRRGAK